MKKKKLKLQETHTFNIEEESKEMEKSSGGFVRADQIDLKSLDEQLERHLNRAWTMEKNKKKNQEDYSFSAATTTTSAAVAPAVVTTTTSRRQRQEWEIDPSKLIIKSVIARGTFGTVHRGVYDGLDVAGQPLPNFPIFFKFNHLFF